MAPEDESDISFGERGGDIQNSFTQEMVVALVRVGIKRNGSEIGDDWLAQCVGGFDGNVEREIIEAALGTLHPVDDAGAVRIGRARAADRHARVLGDMG